MLQVSQRTLDTTKDPGHSATRIAHVVSLFITGFSFSQVRFELEELVQAKAWVSVDGVFGRSIGGIGIDGLVGAASYDENWTLPVR
jgi:hypothetical protein